PTGCPWGPGHKHFQVHKANVDWLGKLPTPLKHPSKGKELICGSTTGAKPALFLLDQRFNYQSNPFFQHPGIYFPREAEECDSPIVGTHPLVHTLKSRDHHPSLPVQQRHCPRCPRNVAEACQPGQPYNIQSLKIPRADLIRSRSSTAGQRFTISATSAGNWMVHLLVFQLCSSLRICVVGLRSSWKYSFHRWIIAPGDISTPSSPRTPNTVCGELPPAALKAPDSLPESSRSRPKVFLHSLTELLPCPRFCLHDCHGRNPLSQPVPREGSPHLWCPPSGTGITATTSTSGLAATARDSCLDNGGAEHGPFRLNVPYHPRNTIKAL
ncbi:hypothetical protein D4764_0236780, partial [Takifugu flavidus]